MLLLMICSAFFFSAFWWNTCFSFLIQLRKLGARNIEVGVGCGVGFGHGFGAGMPYVFQYISQFFAKLYNVPAFCDFYVIRL